MRILLIYFLCFLNLTSKGQKPTRGLVYSIVFASCFQNDSVGLKLNGATLINSSFVSSDSGRGITALAAYQDSHAGWLINKNEKKRLPMVIIKRKIALEVMLNGTWSKFYINLKKGKIMFINNCLVKDLEGRNQKLTVEQYKRNVQLY